jgi:hypothetical protein
MSPFVLAPDSYYNISVSNSDGVISSWSASDSLFGIHLTGSDSPISLVLAPGLMAGGALPFCDNAVPSCFGGAIGTNAAGQINQWNLLLFGGPDVFITYNNPYIGTVDAFSGLGFWENQPGGQPGSRNGFIPSNYAPTPEPSTWAMMLAGFAGLGLAGYRRAKATSAS